MRYDGHPFRSGHHLVIGMCGIMANNVVSSVDNIAAYRLEPPGRTLLSSLSSSCYLCLGLWATTITDLFRLSA